MTGLVRHEAPLIGELVDDLFSPLGSGLFGAPKVSMFSPSLDIRETDKEYMILLDVPGVNKEDLNIQLRDDILTIRGHRQHQSADESPNGLTHLERSYGTFERSVRLPHNVGEVDAELTNGVLRVAVEKPEEAQPRRINIRGTEGSEVIEEGA